MIYVYAKANVKKGCEESFLRIAEGLVHHTRAEAGNMNYYMGRETGNQYIFLEAWKDEASVDLHLSLPHFKEAAEKMQPLLETPLEIHKVEGIY